MKSTNSTSAVAKSILTAVKIRNMTQLESLMRVNEKTECIESAVWKDARTGEMRWGTIGTCEGCGSLYYINAVTVTSGISSVGYGKLDIEECTIEPDTGKCSYCPAEPIKSPTPPPAPMKKPAAVKIVSPAVAAQVAPSWKPRVGDNVVTAGDNPQRGVITKLFYNKGGKECHQDVKGAELNLMVFWMKSANTTIHRAASNTLFPVGDAIITPQLQKATPAVAPVAPPVKDSMANTLFDSNMEAFMAECRKNVNDKTGHAFAAGALKEMLREIYNTILNTTEQRNLLKSLVAMEVVAKQENNHTAQ